MLLLALVMFAMSGCERRGIEEHLVPKGVEPPARSPDEGTGGASVEVSSSSEGDASIPVPPSWELDPEPRPMRLATYVIRDPRAEVAISRFGGRVGGELANVNRWRDQLGLGPIREKDLDAQLERFESPGYEGYMVRLESSRRVMLAVGVYEAAFDRTWFIRTTVETAEIADRIEAEVFSVGRSIASGPRGGGA